MESPYKRQKTFDKLDDFVPLDDASTFNTSNHADDQYQPFRAATEPRADQVRHSQNGHGRDSYDLRNAKDKPKSKHLLPGYEPWVLVRTKFRRRFVHNTKTKDSFWRIPKDVMPGVVEFEKWEKEQKEKAENATWAEEQLKQMREQSKADKVNKAADEEGKSRRRRSESLQREDEEALMAELAAQAEHAEEQDAKETAQSVQGIHQRAQEAGLESDSEYEIVEVTDSEIESEDDKDDTIAEKTVEQRTEEQKPPEDEEAPVEFGEDDIAYQLAAMGEEYGLDPGEYGEDYDGDWEEGAEGLPLSYEDAANLFRDLLDDYRISPFTPWDKIIADESKTSILNDDRYTVLPNMRARKEVFDVWSKSKAAQIKQERAAMEKRDPKIPYLAFLEEKATPKLYWAEFKRKFKKEPEMTDRKLSEKDREKLYRDHISRLKLPESSRKADLQILLKDVPLRALNRSTTLDSLPQQVLSHLHFISIPRSVRDSIIKLHIKTLSNAPDADDTTDEQQAERDKKREERQRREKAMMERERKVEEERRCADKDGARAKRDLREEERELQRAMAVNNRGLKSHLHE